MKDRGIAEIFEISAGIELEGELVLVSTRLFEYKKVTKEQDLFEGTDLIISEPAFINGREQVFDFHVDYTYNFHNKDHMIDLGSVFKGRYAHWYCGIRKGNSHKGFTKFAIPTLVIGFDACDLEVRRYLELIVKEFDENLGFIFDTSAERYARAYNQMRQEQAES